jgi:hypothetical protein
MQNCFQTSHPQMIDITFHTTYVFIYTVNCMKMDFPKAATCYSWLHFYWTSKTAFILLGLVSILHTLCFKPWFWMYFNLSFLPTNINNILFISPYKWKHLHSIPPYILLHFHSVGNEDYVLYDMVLKDGASKLLWKVNQCLPHPEKHEPQLSLVCIFCVQQN